MYCRVIRWQKKKKTLHQALPSAKDVFLSTKYDFFSSPIEVVIAWSLSNLSLTIAMLTFQLS